MNIYHYISFTSFIDEMVADICSLADYCKNVNFNVLMQDVLQAL